MKVITAKNVNYALLDALWHLKTEGYYTGSRNGAVLVAPAPVTTVYLNPKERVLFSPLRDANPFFHLMESIWMLGGANDVEFPARYAKQISAYSDDGLVLAGGYGYRWRNRFGFDQILSIIKLLSDMPDTRRAVLQMWDCTTDLNAAQSGGLDVPCNTQAYFSIVHGKLDMTVCCRSNDAVWGAYGANAVHFSMLHQFIAEAVGVDTGHYFQMSNNLHVYVDRPDVKRLMNQETMDVHYVPDDRYSFNVTPMALVQPNEHYTSFLYDAGKFLSDPTGDTAFTTAFFNYVVAPAQVAHMAFKGGDYEGAELAAGRILATDWSVACIDWIRRHAK